MKRNKRQSESNFDAEHRAAAAEEVNTRSTPTQLTQELGPSRMKPGQCSKKAIKHLTQTTHTT